MRHWCVASLPCCKTMYNLLDDPEAWQEFEIRRTNCIWKWFNQGAQLENEMMQLHCFAKRAPFPGALERLGLGARGGTLSASPNVCIACQCWFPRCAEHTQLRYSQLGCHLAPTINCLAVEWFAWPRTIVRTDHDPRLVNGVFVSCFSDRRQHVVAVSLTCGAARK